VVLYSTAICQETKDFHPPSRGASRRIFPYRASKSKSPTKDHSPATSDELTYLRLTRRCYTTARASNERSKHDASVLAMSRLSLSSLCRIYLEQTRCNLSVSSEHSCFRILPYNITSTGHCCHVCWRRQMAPFERQSSARLIFVPSRSYEGFLSKPPTKTKGGASAASVPAARPTPNDSPRGRAGQLSRSGRISGENYLL
jgi:hypothetical protein